MVEITNIADTIKALEQNGVATSLDVGVHQNCDIHSNCPLAVELRKQITESGVTLTQLLEGFAAGQEESPAYEEPVLPEFNGVAEIIVAGQTIKVDYTESIKTQMGRAYERKIRELQSDGHRARELGRSLYNSYLSQVARLKDTKTLPQLQLPRREILRAGCMMTTDGTNTNYLLYFPMEYKPEYTIHDGVRSKIKATDVVTCTRDAYVEFTITKGRKIVRAELVNPDGSKLQHYHGSEWDCWGAVTLPSTWDGELRSLSNLVIQLRGALATVNMDSLLNESPEDMPTSGELSRRAKAMGREGVIAESTPEVDITVTPQPTARRWGTRTTPALATGTLDEEMMRRYNRTENNREYDTICNLCGVRLGGHLGGRGEICPVGAVTPNPEEEEEFMRRWGVRTYGEAEYLTGADRNCLLCGRDFGQHDGYECPQG